MSVINDMLKDLDKRKAPELGGTQGAHQESLIEAQTFPFKKIALMIVVALSILLATYFFILQDANTSLEQVVKPAKPAQTFEEAGKISQAKVAITANSQEAVSSSKALKYRVEEKPTNSSATVLAKGEKVVVQPLNQEPETTAPELTKIERVASEIKQEPLKVLVVPAKPSVLQSPQTETKLVAASQAVTSKAQKISLKPESLKPESFEQKIEPQQAMQVTLSPIALDQQMAERALMLMSKRQAPEAYRELYAFIGEHEEDMESRAVLASYLLQENRLAEVGDVLLNAPLHKSPTLRQIKARWYVERGEPKFALYTLSSDLPDVAVYPDYYVLLAAYYQRYGTAQEAKKTYSLLVDYDETMADWWAGLALAADRNNEKEKAFYAYQQALDLRGLSPELLNFVRPRLKQLQAAQASLKQ